MFDSADAYDRFMGRYSIPLARVFAEFADTRAGQSVLEVGCGPGALTGELVRIVGDEAVSAVDPSPAFVTAARERHPGVDVREAGAESLPFPDASFDSSLAQLVVHFMSDPVAGLSEMKRVTRPGGVVAACVWDYTRDRNPLTIFWKAARRLDPSIETESKLAGTHEGDLADLFAAADLHDIADGVLEVAVSHPDFDDWWQPFTLGVGPARRYVTSLSADQRERLRSECVNEFPDGPFVIRAAAWAARARA